MKTRLQKGFMASRPHGKIEYMTGAVGFFVDNQNWNCYNEKDGGSLHSGNSSQHRPESITDPSKTLTYS